MVINLDGNAVALGRGALHALRQTLLQDLGDQAAPRLQEAGQAGGPEVYACFQRWLREHQGVDDPGAIDAASLGSVLSEFFYALGWGRVTIERVGTGLAIDTLEWIEADPTANAAYPSCFLSAGLLSDFMGRLADRSLGAMEVECRSCNHPRCRFLVGPPEMIEAVYQAVSEGRDYLSATSS